MTEELDREAVYLLKALSTLAIHGTLAMDIPSRRQVAQALHLIFTEVTTRLSGEDGFPWFECVEAIATLDLPTGLSEESVTARRSEFTRRLALFIVAAEKQTSVEYLTKLCRKWDPAASPKTG